MTSGMTMARKAVALWEKEHPGESLYYQCQRASFYFQWAYEGSTSGIKVYGSAKIAGDNSSFFTKDVNDDSVRAGDEIFYDFGTAGHVVTVVGRRRGRTIVMNTSKTGDKMLNLGNHVSIDYADSIPLTVRGVSRTNGKNKKRSGLTDYMYGAAPASTTPSGSNSDIADDVIDGKYGNGEERVKALGSKYDAVMIEVNKKLAKPAQTVDITALAKEVIAGKHGVGADRRAKLGKDYDAVQAKVNSLLNAASKTNRTYTVQRGDSLSSIATRLKIKGGWQALYAKNKAVVGSNPNVLYSGMVLSI